MSAGPTTDRARTRAGARHPLALALLVTVQFMLILDSTIIGVALPSIAKHLGFAQQDLSWVTNAYVLLFGGFLMLGGRLADILGRRQLFIGSLVFFALASLAGGLATSPGFLIAVRCAQGLASALAAPAALALLLTVFPDNTPGEQAERGKALGVYGAVSGAGGAAGMILGGLLTNWFGWTAVFYVNVPIALIAAYLAISVLPRTDRAGEGGFDLAGALTVTGGLALLVYVLVETDRYGWSSGRTIGLGIGALALLGVFALIESRTRNPIVPLAIFRRRGLRGANFVGALTPAGIVPAIFFLALYTQQVRDYSPLRSGLALVPLAASVVVGATQVGRVIPRLGLRGTTVLGNLLATAGLALVSRIGSEPFMVQQFGPEILIGLGGGTVWVCATVAATSTVPPEEAGLASGLFNTSNQVGAALGLAILATVATSRTNHLLATHAANAQTGGYQVALLGAAGFQVLAVLAALTHLPGKQQPAPAEDAQPLPQPVEAAVEG